MKTYFLIPVLLVALLGNLSLNAQENPPQKETFKIIKTDAAKEYGNGTHTVYVTLNKAVGEESVVVLSKKMESHNDIQRFSFFNNSDRSKFMFTADASVSEERVVEILNREFEALPEDNAEIDSEKINKERISVRPGELRQLKSQKRQ